MCAQDSHRRLTTCWSSRRYGAIILKTVALKYVLRRNWISTATTGNSSKWSFTGSNNHLRTWSWGTAANLGPLMINQRKLTSSRESFVSRNLVAVSTICLALSCALVDHLIKHRMTYCVLPVFSYEQDVNELPRNADPWVLKNRHKCESARQRAWLVHDVPESR